MTFEWLSAVVEKPRVPKRLKEYGFVSPVKALLGLKPRVARVIRNLLMTGEVVYGVAIMRL